jgi:hypothetical protein
MECARRMGRKGFTPAEAEAVLEEASSTRRQLSADNLARFLGVTYAMRQKLGLTTIGSVNVGRKARRELRKHRDRLAKERLRRERGARPQSQSLSRTMPWKQLGMSRANGTGAGPKQRMRQLRLQQSFFLSETKLSHLCKLKHRKWTSEGEWRCSCPEPYPHHGCRCGHDCCTRIG